MLETEQSMRKAQWILDRLEFDDFDFTPDDIFDVLLGNITKPKIFVDDVLRLSENYDRSKKNG
jgi:hypothetical protein